MRPSVPAITAICLAVPLGCGSARHLSRDASGGTIAAHGERHEAMKLAREMMLEHCRGPYQIVEQGPRDGTYEIRYQCGQNPRHAPKPDGTTPEDRGDGYVQPPAPETTTSPDAGTE